MKNKKKKKNKKPITQYPIVICKYFDNGNCKGWMDELCDFWRLDIQTFRYKCHKYVIEEENLHDPE